MSGQRGVMRSFPPVFWLVIVFEFFERGSYYGVMSVLSVYLTDILGFAKEDVGLIKSTIQPLLYFLPIITGALADRFGYRKTLLVAFTLLGGGYFLTAQATAYATVFLSLCVMGLGAGAFKPIISGTIARVTNHANSTMGFGVYYWSINLGAFLFPLILVPILKNNIGWEWVLVAAAIGTGAMILPTLFVYREPVPEVEAEETEQKSLVQTLADAFEIIYAPVILAVEACRDRRQVAVATGVVLTLLAVFGFSRYLAPRERVAVATGVAVSAAGSTVQVEVDRDMGADADVVVSGSSSQVVDAVVTVHRPQAWEQSWPMVSQQLAELAGVSDADPGVLRSAVERATRPPQLRMRENDGATPFELASDAAGGVLIEVADPAGYAAFRPQLLRELRAVDGLVALDERVVDDLFARGVKRPFLFAFVAVLLVAAVVVLLLKPRYEKADAGGRFALVAVTAGGLGALLWLLPGLSLFARIVSTVIAVTVLALYRIEVDDRERFRDHTRFLVLIFLYSGFWVLYFQMMDSVLWYVQAYVDASALDRVVNGALAAFGFNIDWRFDIEHVTVINAGTIILLQLVVSVIVAKTRALPTMIVGIAMGTVGMAILAISTSIWVFIIGTVIFSIGEMTAHPKLISYVGQTAPRNRVATYMGYIFLYGVIGSSIGGVLGAKLYVHYVDHLNQPRTLWLVFSLIGVVTMVGLAIYSRLVPSREA